MLYSQTNVKFCENVILQKKGKTIYTRYKKMDEIYDKYENLRSCRREMVVDN